MPRARRNTLDQAEEGFELPGLENLDQDPEPTGSVPRQRRTSRRATTRTTRTTAARKPRAPSRAQQVNQVRAEIETYLTLANAAWSLRDPECSAVADAAIPQVAERVTALIARNDALLNVVTKSGVVGDVIGLLTAVLPVVRAVWTAHGPGGSGHDFEGADDGRPFPAYSARR